MRIAHLSDLHIASPSPVPLRRILPTKRLTGVLNLMTLRRGAYSLDVLERAVADLLEEGVDHVVITGDLSNLALETEFRAVYDRLKLLGGYREVSTIPGNHDTYTRGSVVMRRFEATFHPFMFPSFSDLDVDLYPYVKLLGDGEVAIVGVSSAVPAPPFFAWGRVGRAQLDRLAELLAQDPVRRAFTVVLIHHNLHSRGFLEDTTASLRDQADFVAVLEEGAVNLVLHGHDHRPYQGALQTADGEIPVFCAGSSTRLDPDPAKVARYNVYTIEWGRLERVETKVYDRNRRRFIWRI